MVWRDFSPGLCLDWGPEGVPNLFSGDQKLIDRKILDEEKIA